MIPSSTRAESPRCGNRFQALKMAALSSAMALLVLSAPLKGQTPEKKAPDPAQVAADAERAKLVVPVPDAATAEYTFGAEQAKPGWEGMEGIGPAKDYFGPGVEALSVEEFLL